MQLSSANNWMVNTSLELKSYYSWTLYIYIDLCTADNMAITPPWHPLDDELV